MKLSSNGRYGVRALFDIAFHNAGKPTQIREIAERQTIPLRFLEQIFQDLKRSGLIGAKRGPHGGYHLLREAERISLGDILRALDGVPLLAFEDDGSRGRPAPDVVGDVLQGVASEVEACFDRVTLADLCARGAELGIVSPARARQNYAI